jgi:TolB protein
MRADGLELRRLTDHTSIDWHPTWSPDGNRLVFESWRDGQPDLYVIDFENESLTRLTQTPQRESHPTWSENGIAFGSLRNGEWGIYLLDPLTAEAQPILTGLGIDPKPVWSMDAEWLVYTAISGGNLDIHMINRNGDQHQAVTRDAFQDDFATWSTDGAYIAYSSNRDGDWRIFIREVTLP